MTTNYLEVMDPRLERAELIAWLFEQGISAEEIDTSFAPMLLPARRAVGDDGSYISARQISERSGLPIDQLIRYQHALGLPVEDDPDAPQFMRPDGDIAIHIKALLDHGIDPDQMLTVVRVLAEGLSNAAEVMRSAVLGAVLHPGATELEVAKRSQTLVDSVAPMLGPMIQDMLFLQLRHATETEAVNASERAEGLPVPGARDVAAAFADLVGFTRLGEELPPEDLEAMSNRLADLARDAAVAPVRFVKTIGDAVMFVSPDPAALLETVLNLTEAAESDDLLPRLRAGITYGSAVSRAGDWFGSPINLASRVTSTARPGSVLVSAEAREQIGNDERFRWSYAGEKELRGIDNEVNLFRARRADPGEESTVIGFITEGDAVRNSKSNPKSRRST